MDSSKTKILMVLKNDKLLLASLYTMRNLKF